MNLRRRTFALTTLILMFSMQMDSEQKNAVDSTASAQSFLGGWDLTLKTRLREYPSWLDITDDDGERRERMECSCGRARSLQKVEISNGRIQNVSATSE